MTLGTGARGNARHGPGAGPKALNTGVAAGSAGIRVSAALEAICALTGRYSRSLALRDPWTFWVSDLDFPGKEHAFTTFPSLCARQAQLRKLMPVLCQFFEEWGCDTAALSRPEDRLLAFQKHWEDHRDHLRKHHAEASRILTVTGQDAQFLRTLDKMMDARRAQFSSPCSSAALDVDAALLAFMYNS